MIAECLFKNKCITFQDSFSRYVQSAQLIIFINISSRIINNKIWLHLRYCFWQLSFKDSKICFFSGSPSQWVTKIDTISTIALWVIIGVIHIKNEGLFIITQY